METRGRIFLKYKESYFQTRETNSDKIYSKFPGVSINYRNYTFKGENKWSAKVGNRISSQKKIQLIYSKKKYISFGWKNKWNQKFILN